MSQISGSVTLDIEPRRIAESVAERVLAAVQRAGLVDEAVCKVAERLSPPVLYERLAVCCLRRVATDQPGRDAFEFLAPATGAQFVLHACAPEGYVVGATYTLTVTLAVGDTPESAGRSSPLAEQQTTYPRTHTHQLK